MCHGGLAAATHTLHGEGNRGAKETQEGDVTEIVHIREQGRLLIDGTLEEFVSLASGGGKALLLCHERPYRLVLLLESMAGAGDGIHQVIAMYLLVPREHCIHDRDADAAADIAHEVVKAAGVADLLVRQSTHGNRRQRYEDEADGCAAENDRPKKRPRRNLQVGAREREAAKRGEDESATDEEAIIDTIGQDADDRHEK